jgi:transcriptional regulator with XRE-family HTH domain
VDFDALLWQAIRRCDGQSGLARRLGYNKSSIRQWLLGLALPDATVEPRLAEFAGVTPDVLRQAIRDEAMRRWDRARDLQPVGGRRARRPYTASDKTRAGRTVLGWLLAVSLGLVPFDVHAGPGRRILSLRRKWAPQQAWRHAA